MKKHKELLTAVIFYVVAALLMYVLYKVTYEKPRYIQNNKTINLEQLKKPIY